MQCPTCGAPVSPDGSDWNDILAANPHGCTNPEFFNAEKTFALFRSAPELLDVCKWLLNEVCRSRYGYKMHPDDRMELMGKLCEVIAKAEGGKQ